MGSFCVRNGIPEIVGWSEEEENKAETREPIQNR